MNKLNKWLLKKKSEDTALTQFLRLAYFFGQKSWVHTTLSAIFGITIPLLFEHGHKVLFIVLLFIMVLDIIYVYICDSYKKGIQPQQNFAFNVLSNQSSLLKSVAIEIENNKDWKNKIFKTVSDLVCEKIYQDFKDVFNCETRVAVEYIFNKTNNSTSSCTKYVKMSGRRSNKRATVKKSIMLEKRKNIIHIKYF